MFSLPAFVHCNHCNKTFSSKAEPGYGKYRARRKNTIDHKCSAFGNKFVTRGLSSTYSKCKIGCYPSCLRAGKDKEMAVEGLNKTVDIRCNHCEKVLSSTRGFKKQLYKKVTDNVYSHACSSYDGKRIRRSTVKKHINCKLGCKDSCLTIVNKNEGIVAEKSGTEATTIMEEIVKGTKTEISKPAYVSFTPGHDKEAKIGRALPNTNCTICLDVLPSYIGLVTLKCGHFFHSGCIRTWLTKMTNSCPICKQTVTNLYSNEPVVEIIQPIPNAYTELIDDPEIIRRIANQ